MMAEEGNSRRLRERLKADLVDALPAWPLLLAGGTAHVALVVWSYSGLGALRCGAAATLFTVGYLLSLFSLKLLLALAAGALAALLGYGLVEAGGPEALLGGALVLGGAYLLIWALVVLGPPLLCGLAAGIGAESIILGIVVGVLALIVWGILFQVLKGISYSFAAGGLAHLVTFCVVTKMTVEEFVGAHTTHDIMGAMKDLPDGLWTLLKIIRMPLPMAVWVFVVGVWLGVRKLYRRDED